MTARRTITQLRDLDDVSGTPAAGKVPVDDGAGSAVWTDMALAPDGVSLLATATAANVDTFFRTCWFKGKLYAGGGWSQAGGNLGGIVYEVDLTSGVLTLAYDTGEQSVRSMAVFQDTLYVGTGVGGKVFSYDGTTWALANTGTAGSSEICMAVWRNKLYVGETATAKVFSYDGTTWATAFTLPSLSIHAESLCVFQDALWIGDGKSATAWGLYMYDGTNLGLVFSGSASTKSELLGLASWRGKMYAGEYDSDGAAKLLEYDPATGLLSTVTVGASLTAIYSLTAYRDNLYIGTHNSGKLYRYNGISTLVATLSDVQSLRDLFVVGDRLILATRVSGTPSTGGAIHVFGDHARATEGPANQVADTVEAARSGNLSDVWIGTFDPRSATTPLSVAANNRAYFNRVKVKQARYVAALRTSIGTQSGNICVGIYYADGAVISGTTAKLPVTLLATSGSVACPASGTRTVDLTAGVWLLPGDYWFALGADNTTATFAALNPTVIIPDLSGFQDTAFPLPASAGVTTGLSPRQYPLWI